MLWRRNCRLEFSPSSLFWESTAPIPVDEASTCKKNGLRQWKTEAEELWKTVSASGVQTAALTFEQERCELQ